MTVELILCETCRPSGPPGAEGEPRPGALLAEKVREAFAADPELSAVRLSTIRCLMSCKRACAVHVRGPGRMGYVLGDLPADESSVETLTAYLRAYLRTGDGQVPFREWPSGVRGRFVARIPPLPQPLPQPLPPPSSL
ncbi:DUF1636 domain-containing protein [Azospirillum thermophilum]|uniref:Metal-binding protein n=1 Tax=Azospirillum thermophilum TaxID=2202148 RepID=A0A2S2CVP3_9PROT|nr:DUF1636 domain-containing protein [Azospirillum thermophilum]AWK88450.1 hypothetical protein DEW08_20485 [Azospirillum thermophilum]